MAWRILKTFHFRIRLSIHDNISIPVCLLNHAVKSNTGRISNPWDVKLCCNLEPHRYVNAFGMLKPVVISIPVSISKTIQCVYCLLFVEPVGLANPIWYLELLRCIKHRQYFEPFRYFKRLSDFVLSW